MKLSHPQPDEDAYTLSKVRLIVESSRLPEAARLAAYNAIINSVYEDGFVDGREASE